MNLEHPFVLGHYHLKTPDINRLCKQLKFWVYASIKGGMIIGESASVRLTRFVTF